MSAPTKRPHRAAPYSSLYATDAGTPLAVPPGKLSAMLGRPLADVEAAVAQVDPYRHADGSPRYSILEVRRVLAGRRPRRREHVRTRQE